MTIDSGVLAEVLKRAEATLAEINANPFSHVRRIAVHPSVYERRRAEFGAESPEPNLPFSTFYGLTIEQNPWLPQHIATLHDQSGYPIGIMNLATGQIAWFDPKTFAPELAWHQLLTQETENDSPKSS